MKEVFQVLEAQSKEEFEVGKSLFREYAEELDISLEFQNFEKELAEIQLQYGQVGGVLLLAKSGTGEWLGCVGVRAFENGIGELKRMYVRNRARGWGVGRKLLKEAIKAARQLQYKKLRLDTLPAMKGALYLYQQEGFYEIPSYRFNPVENTVFLEKLL